MEIELSKEAFLDRVYRKSKSKQSRKIAKTSLGRFESYCLSRFQRSSDELISKMKKGELDVYRVLDDFVTYLDKDDVGNGIKTYMNWAKQYLVYCEVDLVPYKFKQRVNMPQPIRRRDAELTRELVSRILQNLPVKMRLLCMLVMTSLRRPNEVARLRVRDFDLQSNPAIITIPANISKNRIEEPSFTTSETADLLSDYIKRNRLKDDDYVFGTWATGSSSISSIDNLFRYHMKKLPDLCDIIEGMKQKRFKIHVYCMKKFGYTRADKKWGKNYADGLKGDKNSEYHRLPLEEKKQMYIELETELTIFNADREVRSSEDRISRLEKKIDYIMQRYPRLRVELQEGPSDEVEKELAAENLIHQR